MAALDLMLEGQVAIVTGASSGIGAATAAVLGAAGVRVTLAARRGHRLREVLGTVTGSGGEALAVVTDVTRRTDVEAMVARTLADFGRIDILVNNAGVMPLSAVRALRVDEWDLMIDTNVKGVLYCIAAVLPTMLGQGRGHIVNVSSLAARRPFPTGTIYSASKFAVRAISAGLRHELSPNDGIRVTDIEPGVVDTELPDRIGDDDAAATFSQRWVGRRRLSAADVARAIYYAVSQPEHVNVNEILVRPTDQET